MTQCNQHDHVAPRAPVGPHIPALKPDRTFRSIGIILLLSTLLLATLVVLPRGPLRLVVHRLPLLASEYANTDEGSKSGLLDALGGGSESGSASSGGGGGRTGGSGSAPRAPPAVQREHRVGQQSKERRDAEQQDEPKQQQHQQPAPPSRQQPVQPPAEEVRPVVHWRDGDAFHAPESRCTIRKDGAVAYDASPSPASGMPFLFDVNQFGSKTYRERMCGAGIDDSWRGRYKCYGPCIFESRLCDTHYPGANKSQAVVAQYHAAGWRFDDLSPCELFQRIRGRTLWFMGDSQTCHFYYAAECFLREFAPRMSRSRPFPKRINDLFSTHDPPIYPKCLELAHNTRVCQLRVDEGVTLVGHVLPLMLRHNPSFANDIMLFNFGLHYGKRGSEGFLQDIASVIRWRQQRRRAARPRMVWMDVPLQHFDTHDGKFNKAMIKNKGNMKCANLTTWYAGVPEVVGGGKKNMLAQPHIAAMADAHLQTWNASAPLWDVHMPGECTHYCSPTAYHVWLALLIRELAGSGVGTSVALHRASPAESLARAERAAPAVAVAGAEAAEAGGAAATAAAAAAAADHDVAAGSGGAAKR